MSKRIRYRIAYAYPTSKRATQLGFAATGCHYVQAETLREDGTWSAPYVAPGTEGEASVDIAPHLHTLLSELQGVPGEGPSVRVLSIDAWRASEGGWEWNNWHELGRVPSGVATMSPRTLLRYLRKEGYLTSRSAGRVQVDDDGYNMVIMLRSTAEPVLAIEYGANQE